MKKHNLLSILVVLVLIAMCLPWAAYVAWATPDGAYYRFCGEFFFLGAFALGYIHFTAAVLFAFLALWFAFFSAKSRGCSIVCCILLLLSATSLMIEGAPRFDLFTPLTWMIFVALIGISLFAFFGFRKKSAAESFTSAL